MKEEADYQFLYRLSRIALIVSLVSLLLLMGINLTQGNVSIALWILLILMVMFVSIPLHGFILLNSLFRLSRGQGKVLRWVYLYLSLAVVGHYVVATNWGGFEHVKDDIYQKLDLSTGQQ